jgi:hypothetical protein
MSGSTNFQQWNPSQANQESDLAYTSDTQRIGGAANGSPLPSMTGNKLFYQLSTGITALMQMMAAKGFTCSDGNLASLASVLAAIQTTADLKNPLQTVAYASSVVCNCGLYDGFQISLNGSIGISFSNAYPGQVIVLILINDESGSHTITWPGSVTGASQPDAAPNAISSMILVADAAGTGFSVCTPMISNTGVNGTAIGASSPSTGVFTSLSASEAAISTLTVSGNGSITGNSTVTGVVQATKILASESSDSSGGFSFTQDIGQDTGMFSSGDGIIDLKANNSVSAVITSSGITASVPITASAGATINGGSLGGTFTGNPSLSGSVTTNVVTTATPASNDSSYRVPNTSWVQTLIASIVGGSGFAISLNSEGYIKLPSILGGLVIQWGTGPIIGGGATAYVYFPIGFLNQAFTVVLSAQYTSGHTAIQSVLNGSISTVGFTATSGNGGETDGMAPFNWIAIGY